MHDAMKVEPFAHLNYVSYNNYAKKNSCPRLFAGFLK